MIPGPRHLWTSARRLDPVRLDYAIAVIVFVIGEYQIWSPARLDLRLGHAIGTGMLSFGLAVRRRWLLQTLVIATILDAGSSIALGSNVNDGPGGVSASFAALLLFYAGGAYLRGSRSLYALALGMLLMSVNGLSSPNQVVANLVWDDMVIAPLPWFLGRVVQTRAARARASRERAERMDAEHEYHARAAALGERARLAREIHDVIAHSVSVMVIQTAGARAVMDRDPDRAAGSLGSVERAGREALAEMRRLLGVLGDGGELRELAPQPGLDELDDLVARTAATGLDTSLEIQGAPKPVSPGLGLCAYRVIQEALTNTIKHASATQATVAVRWSPDALELEVCDDGSGVAGLLLDDSGGHGITGMRERAALHGGTIETGRGSAGGFVVRARIPLLETQPA